ncbi:MAG: hypothetical protein ACUVV4_01880 [Candidatus Bathyarchaeia archaeon]
MNKIIKALISAVVIFLSFVFIPLIVIMLIPEEIVGIFSRASINLSALQNEIILTGAALSALSFFKNVFDEASVGYLIASVLSNLAWLIYGFIFLGLGDLQRLGVIEVSMEFENGLNQAAVDIRFFVYLGVAIVALKIIHTIIRFREARIEREKLKSEGQTLLTVKP